MCIVLSKLSSDDYTVVRGTAALASPTSLSKALYINLQQAAKLARSSSLQSYIRRNFPFLLPNSDPPRATVSLSRRESGHSWGKDVGNMASQGNQTPGPHDPNQGYLKSSLGKLSPWTRSPSIAPSKVKDGEPPEAVLQEQKGADHRVSTRHRLSLRKYPKDCPPLRVQWFHAVDVPKRRPNPAGVSKKEEKPPGAPKKYAAFSKRDSKALEVAFNKLADEEDAVGRAQLHGDGGDIGTAKSPLPAQKPNIGLNDGDEPGKVKVPVNEDYLFDVDVERRELLPAYWLGPVYDVRRGTWFYQDGAIQRPCDENLASQLEEGYLKTQAWKLPSTQASASAAQQKKASETPASRGRPASWAPGEAEKEMAKDSSWNPLASKPSNPDLRAVAKEEPKDGKGEPTKPSEHPQNTYRLFGSHMNSVVTYEDSATAWLLTDDFMSRMNYTMYSRFAGGGHFAGMKMTRGYNVTPKKTDATDGKSATQKRTPSQERVQREHYNKVMTGEQSPGESRPSSNSENRRQTLERQMSTLLSDQSSEDPAKQEEERRKRDEKEIEDDYREQDGDDQDREIEHLILVTHGIGQRLGLRLESVNFVHDVNTLRKTLKAVYAESPDLKALNSELDTLTNNCRIQVLPICWRHLLDFPKQSLKHNRKEHDLADSGFGEEEDYPNLEDISVEGVPAVRNLITDLALDILLYQSPAYKDHISRIVLQECNRIYHLFIDRNPAFKGKVSMIGHSLGSAIMFDILCSQEQHKQGMSKKDHPLKLDFEVSDFYALGSPIGLFQMLKGRTIGARPSTSQRGRTAASTEDPFLAGPSTANNRGKGAKLPEEVPSDLSVSSPKCAQIFNIFHPTDPISYRIEPFISPAMASLKPQLLPYTKRGIFGAPVGQGFTGIGARVGQSVSSLWSSMSSGIASSLLTRGLGYTGDDTLTATASSSRASRASSQPPQPSKTSTTLSAGPGTNVQAGAIPFAPLPPEGTEIAHVSSDASGTPPSRPPTLISGQLETLYSGYQKRRRSLSSDDNTRDLGAQPATSPKDLEAQERERRLKREEDKVRRLNGNGRVDYAIQEGAFDINLLAAIASHLSYWGDEDVGHFLISQLLSRQRVLRDKRGAEGSSQEEIGKK